jgi:hypothetical protein
VNLKIKVLLRENFSPLNFSSMFSPKFFLSSVILAAALIFSCNKDADNLLEDSAHVGLW